VLDKLESELSGQVRRYDVTPCESRGADEATQVARIDLIEKRKRKSEC
jgi:hypothetical protein